MLRSENTVVGLDVGTTKICAIIGQVNSEGLIDVIGLGTAPSKGLRRGVVVNIDQTVSSIRKAVDDAELMAGCRAETVFAGISGGHIKGINSHGVIAIKNREVTAVDVARVIDAARAVAIPMDREVIHILPQEFMVDDQEGIKEPIGMAGVRLEAKVHIITGAVSAAQNIIRCANRSNLRVNDLILQQMAAAEAVLSSDEKELGVALVDIGGGTTDIAVFSEGSIQHTSVISVGGEQLTNDIAVGLRTPMVEAEKIKKRHGCALGSMVSKDETITVPGVGGRQPRVLSRSGLADITEPRLEELLGLVRRELERFNLLPTIASGIVLTGGTVAIEGICELAEQIFDMPVRLGYPVGISGLVDVVNSPVYATGVGLVLWGARNKSVDITSYQAGNGMFDRVMGRMKQWFTEAF
ncbi:cell division protein FtsA [Desulfomonile tiedjei]|uniref:Cell division protein FtsA n=1 Tax=Desulfomonile tiedjei (strain ATCC 49306 / DSM 6799 / DCB-1) TaxID=706587 RepID=I4CCP2_DESTA|nr:cell division protein FtsA [Desulfomonile tiedjei]AFM27333.1 cell division protein FtsA [Desulfomonile tiedjei DSM 6799]